MQLRMSLSMEQVLADAQMLVGRLKEHDSAADSLLSTTQTMYRRIDSMKQYEAGLNQLNEMGRHRPRSNLILALVKENNQIRQLQQENKDLRACLEEHQSAIELIMSKYREQVAKLLVTKNMQPADLHNSMTSDQANVDKIVEMAAIMQRAAHMDETNSHQMRARLAQLETENRTLRELLKISVKQSREVTHLDCQVQVDPSQLSEIPHTNQVSNKPACNTSPTSDSSTTSELSSTPGASTDTSGAPDVPEVGSPEPEEEEENHFATNDGMNSSVVENKLLDLFKGPLASMENVLGISSKAKTDKSSPSKESTPENTQSQSSTQIGDVTDTIIQSHGDVTITNCDDLDTTVVDNNSLGEQENENTPALNVTLVNHTSCIKDESGEVSLDDKSGTESSSKTSANKTPLKANETETLKRTPTKSSPASQKNASGRKAAMTTIKRGKGKSIIQDLNANTGSESGKTSPRSSGEEKSSPVPDRKKTATKVS